MSDPFETIKKLRENHQVYYQTVYKIPPISIKSCYPSIKVKKPNKQYLGLKASCREYEVIKTILLAVDLGVYTSHLLQHAASLSKHYSARLVVVHAVEPLGSLGTALINTYLQPEVSKELTTVGMDSIIDQIRFRVIDSLTDEYMNGDIDLPRLGEVIVKTAPPVEAILTTAEEFNADLLVLGSHSPEVEGRQLGTVAHKVLNISKRPVYLVPHAQPIWHKSGDMSHLRL